MYSISKVTPEKSVACSALYDHPDVGIAYVLRQRIVRCNSAFRRIVGVGDEETVVAPWHIVRSPASRAATPLCGGVNVESVEIRKLRGDGSAVSVKATLIALASASVHEEAILMVENTKHPMRSDECPNDQKRHDRMTGLATEALFLHRVEQFIATPVGARHGFALLILGMDHFRRINQMLGLAGGDLVLRQIGRRLQQHLIQPNLIGRVHGDQFAIMLAPPPKRALTDEFVEGAVDALLDCLAQPIELAGHYTSPKASVGISIFPRDGKRAGTLTKHAEAAMYQAKESGRGCYRFYKPTIQSRIEARMRVERDLQAALRLGQLELHYQPMIELASGAVATCEALVRWRHPKMGLLPAASFIPVAEDCGLIIQMGEWAMRTACRQLQEWRAASLATVPVAVNVSPRQFDRHDIGSQIAEAMRDAAIGPGMLELEITERLSVQDPQKTIDFIKRMKDLGVAVAIDDFGTGHANLSFLKQFAIDKLKLDRVFVSDITTSARDAAICKTAIDLGHCLKLTVVAEGVELPEQRALLKEQGCDHAQGYLFGPALPASDFARLLGPAGGMAGEAGFGDVS